MLERWWCSQTNTLHKSLTESQKRRACVLLLAVFCVFHPRVPFSPLVSQSRKKNNHTGTGFARVKHFLVPAKSEDNRLRERDATPMAAKLLKAKFKGQRKQKQVAWHIQNSKMILIAQDNRPGALTLWPALRVTRKYRGRDNITCNTK